MDIVGAVFETQDQVREAYSRLQDAGVAGDDIGILARDVAPEERRVEEVTHTESGATGAGVGTAVGGTAGWVAGWGAAGASLAVPVVGPVLAAGAIAGIVAAAGGTLGWLAGGLVGEGMSESEARHYQQAVERGAILLTVRTPRENAERARAVLRLCGGQEYGAS